MDLTKGNCCTFVHCTGRENAKNILKEGLIMPYMQVSEDYCVMGGEIRNHCVGISEYDIDKNKEFFDNLEHRGSNCVVVLRLPNGFFTTFDRRYPTPYGDSIEYNDKDVLKIRPEFICGYYDKESKTFVDNPQYYDNLSEYEKIICDDKLQQCYELAKVHPAYTNHTTAQEKRLRENNSNGQVAKKQKKEVHEQVHCEFNTSGWTVGDEDEDSASPSL